MSFWVVRKRKQFFSLLETICTRVMPMQQNLSRLNFFQVFILLRIDQIYKRGEVVKVLAILTTWRCVLQFFYCTKQYYTKNVWTRYCLHSTLFHIVVNDQQHLIHLSPLAWPGRHSQCVAHQRGGVVASACTGKSPIAKKRCRCIQRCNVCPQVPASC